jgi:hypothetical protein
MNENIKKWLHFPKDNIGGNLANYSLDEGI